MLHAKKDATQIDVHDSIPLLLRDVGRGLNGVFDPRIVEGEVQPPEGFARRPQRPLYILAAPDVAYNRECLSAEFPNHARCFLILLFGNVSDDHARTLARKRKCSCASNAVRCSGYTREPLPVFLISLLCVLLSLSLFSLPIRYSLLPQPAHQTPLGHCRS